MGTDDAEMPQAALTPPEEKPVPSAVSANMLEPLPTLFCSWCKTEAPLTKVRVTSKAASTYKCSSCNNTFTKCIKHLGSWPTAGFKAMTADDQADFYKKAKLEKSSIAVANLAERSSEKYSFKETSYALGGKFLPLDVWQRKGFDPVMIAKNTGDSDITHSVQCGKCYRVKLLSTQETGGSGSRDSDKAIVASGKRPLESSADHANESKRDFEDRMRDVKAARRVVDQRIQQNKCLASAFAKKLAGPISKLQSAMETPDYSFLSAHARETAAEALQKASTTMDKLKADPPQLDSEDCKNVVSGF
jgi:hypothetical protein